MDSLKVSDYMTLQAVTFSPDMSLSAALEKVVRSDNMGGPVINAQRHVIGFYPNRICWISWCMPVITAKMPIW